MVISISKLIQDTFCYMRSQYILTLYVTLVNNYLKMALVVAVQMKIDAKKN
ncbi:MULTISPECIES: hypothetical protein [Oscillatoriales]|uniref:hypothetical protein n=1 Tax=Oscillatoriophycideae TaxID=1301283 RepID=UPI001682BE1D|nr:MULTISPECIES: hypothetical protein [Oscillatoriales]